MTTPAQAAERRLRAAHFPSLIAPLLKRAGADMVCLSPGASHYRITVADGRQFDVWGSTHRWLRTKTNVGGQGLPDLMEAMGRPEPRGVEPAVDGAERVHLVTIFCDASYIHQTRNGGWGGWIKGDGEPQTHFGPLRDTPHSTEAEMRAIANCIYLALKGGLVKSNSRILVQTDNINALRYLLSFVPKTHASDSGEPGCVPIQKMRRMTAALRASPAFVSIQDMVRRNDLHLIVSHVKGHNGQKTERSRLNHLVDRLAKKGSALCLTNSAG